MKTMKNAKYYIDLILISKHSKDEWKRIQREVDEWLHNCSEEERDEFTYSGAGETLYMMCTAIDNMERRTSPLH